MIVHFKNLKKLVLHRNAIENIHFHLLPLEHLQYLDLSNNPLENLVFMFQGLPPSLTTLIMCECDLENLPNEISLLTSLEHLDLGSNNLRTLPAEIGQLTNLKVLHLDDNSMDFLPAAFSDLKNIEDLDISDNNFADEYGLPLTFLLFSFCSSPHLRTLYIAEGTVSPAFWRTSF